MKNPLTLKAIGYLTLQQIKYLSNRKVIIKKDAIFLGTKANTSKVEPKPLNVSIFYDLMPSPSCCTISSYSNNNYQCHSPRISPLLATNSQTPIFVINPSFQHVDILLHHNPSGTLSIL